MRAATDPPFEESAVRKQHRPNECHPPPDSADRSERRQGATTALPSCRRVGLQGPPFAADRGLIAQSLDERRRSSGRNLPGLLEGVPQDPAQLPAPNPLSKQYLVDRRRLEDLTDVADGHKQWRTMPQRGVDARVEQETRVSEPLDLLPTQVEGRQIAEQLIRLDPLAERPGHQCVVEIDLDPCIVSMEHRVAEPHDEPGPWFRKHATESEIRQKFTGPIELPGSDQDVEVPEGTPRRIRVPRVSDCRTFEDRVVDPVGIEGRNKTEQTPFQGE